MTYSNYAVAVKETQGNENQENNIRNHPKETNQNQLH
jgi:hypothetical protein